MKNTVKKQSQLFVQSLRKGFDVLEAFKGVRSLSLSEIAERVQFDKSATQRMCHTLTTMGYLQQCPTTRRFELSPKCLDITFEFLRHHPLIERATPILIDLRRQCDERVDLSLFWEKELIYVQRHQSQRQLFYTTLIGRRIPLYCSAGGRAVLAKFSDDIVSDLIEHEDRIAMTRFTKTDIEDILNEIDTARQQGWSLARSEVIENEMVFAAAITNSMQQPIGAIHVACNVAAQDELQPLIDRIVPGLTGAARMLSS